MHQDVQLKGMSSFIPAIAAVFRRFHYRVELNSWLEVKALSERSHVEVIRT
jgi:hypothetical protein